MRTLGGPFRVYVGLSPMGYLNPAQLEQTVREGMLFCGTPAALEKLPRPTQVVLKPNAIFTHPLTNHYSYTHPEVLRATLSAFFGFLPGARVRVVEKSYGTSNTKSIFRKAAGASDAFKANGYFELERMFPGQVSLVPMEESPLVRYQLSKDGLFENTNERATLLGRARNEIVTSCHFENSAFTICTPKIQTGLYSEGFSGALATAGSLDSAYEILGNQHDRILCDALEVCFPRLIVSDGIIVPSGGSYLSQRAHELGVVLVANNPVAHDWIAAKLLNLDPMKIPLIKFAVERGWGPSSASVIELGGAAREGLQLLAQKTQYWDMGVRESDFEHPFETMQTEPAVEHDKHAAVLLDWFHQANSQRYAFSKAPPLSVASGSIRSYPKHSRVVLIGDDAIRSLSILTSSTSRLSLKMRLLTIEKAQLKNGKRHWLFKVHDRDAGIPPSFFAISLAFAVATLGRLGATLMKIHGIRKNLLSKQQSFSDDDDQDLPIVATSRLPHNKWWSLKKPSPFSESVINAPQL